MNENFFEIPKQKQNVELVEMTTDNSFIEPTIEELDEMFSGLKAVMPTTETGVKSKEEIISETKEKITNLVDSISRLPGESKIKITELTSILEKLRGLEHVDSKLVYFFKTLIWQKIIDSDNDSYDKKGLNKLVYEEVVNAIKILEDTRFYEEEARGLNSKLDDVRSGIDDL